MSNQSPVPPLTDEEIKTLRHNLANPTAQIRIQDTPPPFSRCLAVVKRGVRTFLVCAGWAGGILSFALVEQDVPSAYNLWMPRGEKIVMVVSDYVGKIGRREIDPSSFSPSKDFIVIGKDSVHSPELDAILPPEPPKLMLPPEPITNLRLAVIDARVGAATANSVAAYTRPIVLASSGLPIGSIDLMEKLTTPIKDLEVWEL